MAHCFDRLLDPTEHPDYTRRAIRVPTWETFEGTTQFTALRMLPRDGNRLTHVPELLDLYTKTFDLGRVIWPNIMMMRAENAEDFVEEIRKRGLYLFDIWGFVPGGVSAPWLNWIVAPETVAHLEELLGDRFLGYDNGEQDGRYVGTFAKQQCPAAGGRYERYLHFQKHFEKLAADFGDDRMATLVSLCFGHYFVKEGNHKLIGAETAQALPNSQVYYAFIRGAGKQYGVHWFGNASVFNRWGYKSYTVEEDEQRGKNLAGPTAGTSLSLLRRLLYTHIFYNSVIAGFEQSWFMGEDTEMRLHGKPCPMDADLSKVELSPVGVIQRDAVRFVRENGTPGVMHTPAALLLDFFSGWAMPRHLYSRRVFQAWGAEPYGAGDYLTDALLGMVYPGYEDASFFADERGFLSPTPFGDMVDCVLSDIPGWVLGRYALVVAAGRLPADEELRDKLAAHAKRGGHVVLTAANARALWPEWGLTKGEDVPAGATIRWADGTETAEEDAFCLWQAGALPADAEVLGSCGERPAVFRIPWGQGAVTLLLSPFGLNRDPLLSKEEREWWGRLGRGHERSDLKKTLPRAFRLLAHVRRIVGDALRREQIFSVGEGLGYITCRKEEGRYRLAIYSNERKGLPFKIESHCGEIGTVRELAIDQSAKEEKGYLPKDQEDNDRGENREGILAGGDVRVFDVDLEREVNVVVDRGPDIPPRPLERYVSLGCPERGIKETVLAWPTFFQHFSGVKVDWTYLRNRDQRRLQWERRWLDRQQLDLIVDLTSGLNNYPDLTVSNLIDVRYAESQSVIESVFDKMQLLGAGHAVFSLHCVGPYWIPNMFEHFRDSIGALCAAGDARGICLHLQHHPGRMGVESAGQALALTGEGPQNLRFALNTGHVLMSKETPADLLEQAGARIGMVLYSAPAFDLYGQAYDCHAALSGAPCTDLSGVSKLDVPQVLDAAYEEWNDVYRDLRHLWG